MVIWCRMSPAFTTFLPSGVVALVALFCFIYVISMLSRLRPT